MGGPATVVEVGGHPEGILYPKVNVLLAKELETGRDRIAVQAGLAAAFPALVGDDQGFPPVGRDEQARVALGDVLKIAEPRIVSPDGDDVSSLFELRTNVDFVIGPMMLKAPGRAPADVLPVDVKLVGLIRRDEEGGLGRDLPQVEGFAKERVAVVKVPMVIIGPDPLGMREHRFDAIAGMGVEETVSL